MFCPKCGAQNVDDASFCRGCGEDLGMISQALSRKPSFVIAQKLDEALKRSPMVQLTWLKNQKRRGAGELLSGALTMFVIVWFLALGHGNPAFAVGVIAAIACYLLTLGAWDLWTAPKRAADPTSDHASDVFGSSTSAGELPSPVTADFPPVASVTESTTRVLKEPKTRN